LLKNPEIDAQSRLKMLKLSFKKVKNIKTNSNAEKCWN